MSAVAAINASAPELPREQPPQRKRGNRGEIGDGTRSGRVKTAWRSAMRQAGAPKNMTSLRQFAVDVMKGRKAPGYEVSDELRTDIAGWLEVKTHVHTPAVRKAMKEAKSRKRSKPKKPSKDRRRVKGNSGKR